MRYILILLIASLSSSCGLFYDTLSSEKVAKHATPILEKMATTTPTKTDFCIFDYVLVKKAKKNFDFVTEQNNGHIAFQFPVFVGNETKIRVEISPEIIAQYIENQFVSIASDRNIKELLNGRKIYLIFVKIPNYSYFYQDEIIGENKPDDFQNKNEILANSEQFIIKYSFIEEKNTTSERVFQFPADFKMIQYGGKWKKKIRRYFNDYQMNLSVVAAELFNKIEADLVGQKSN